MYWLVLYFFKRKKNRCPRCGNIAFVHGFKPFEEYYCTKCHLWEPDWEKQKQFFNEFLKKQEIEGTVWFL